VPDVWFFFDGRVQTGPVTLASLKAKLATLQTPNDVLVWSPGFAEWKRPADVPEFAIAVPPQEPAAEVAEPPPAVSDDSRHALRPTRWRTTGYAALVGLAIALVDGVWSSIVSWSEPWTYVDIAYALSWGGFIIAFVTLIGFIVGVSNDRARASVPVVDPQPSGNVLVRHWRGENPLWMAFWVFGILANGVLSALKFVVDARLIFVLWLVVTPWQFVGIWRSADNSVRACARSGNPPIWASLAKIYLVCMLLLLIGALLFMILSVMG